VRDATGARSLDFVVIGVQKGGTTSLWQYLRSHPRIRFPLDKEAPFFVSPDADDPQALARLVAADFADAPEDALLGTVTPHYMMGNASCSAEQIAARIATALPEVRIVALLRDPIERAISHHRMSVRRGWEARSFDDAATDLLDPARAAEARESATEANAYLAQGEYGRILRGYRERIPAERTLVAFTHELEADPGRVVDDVLAFLGLPPGHRPDDLGSRYHRGGARRRIDEQAERDLVDFLAETIWPALPEGHAGPRAFGFFLETWNIVPDEEATPVSPPVRAGLEAHFAADAELLAELGIGAPWLDAWAARRESPAPATVEPTASASEERDLRRSLTDAHDRLLRREEELAEIHARLTRVEAQEQRLTGELGTAREQLGGALKELSDNQLRLEASRQEALRLRTRLDRILQLPPFRLYASLQRLPGVRRLARRRTAGFAAEVARRDAERE
jgi:Sulfotransferase family